ncbi:hypothetical protein [Halorussus salinus]|uniref:hypothetical protein n=1 Tax=Halorussus salinus TaxID=1364935 RepID=UPI001091EF50|nr:hypothetical protein [Halorussus salinus]
MHDDTTDEAENGLTRRNYVKAVGTAVGAVSGLTLGATPSAAQQTELVYGGTANTVILAGDGISVTQNTYQRNVILVFGPPKQGGLAETNPFSLFVGPADRNETGQPGHYEVHSAALVGSNLFQYWDLQLQGNGGFAGTLTDPHNAEGLVWNIINVERALIPGRPNLGVLTTMLGMGVGTQISGAVTDASAEVRLQGATIDQFTQFSSQISAARIA